MILSRRIKKLRCSNANMIDLARFKCRYFRQIARSIIRAFRLNESNEKIYLNYKFVGGDGDSASNN